MSKVAGKFGLLMSLLLVTSACSGADTGTTRISVTTTARTTSTTAPISDESLDARQMAAVLDQYAADVSSIRDSAVLINAQWDDRQISFSEADERLSEIQAALSELQTEVVSRSFGNSVSEQRSKLLQIVKSMEEDVVGMIDGLHAADTGHARRTALGALLTDARRIQSLQDELDAMAWPATALTTQLPTTTTTSVPRTTTTTVDPSDVVDQAASYLQTIRQALLQNDYNTVLLDDWEVERELAMAGLTVCNVFSAGRMVDLVAPSLTGDRDFDSLLYFAMVGSAVINFCPEEEDSLGRFIVEYNP